MVCLVTKVHTLMLLLPLPYLYYSGTERLYDWCRREHSSRRAFDLKARVRRQKLNLQGAALEREIKYEEMKREIIEMYTTANSQLSVLKLRAEALELATLQYEIAEKNFANNSIDTGDLSVEKQRHLLNGGV